MFATAPVSRSQAALLVLVVLQLVMLGSLFAQLPPHPPRTIPFFALGPFLGASVAIAAAAMVLGAAGTGAGKVMSLVAAAAALISFGPQKWLDPAIGEIWPAVLVAQIAVLVLIAATCPGRKARAAG